MWSSTTTSRRRRRRIRRWYDFSGIPCHEIRSLEVHRLLVVVALPRLGRILAWFPLAFHILR